MRVRTEVVAVRDLAAGRPGRLRRDLARAAAVAHRDRSRWATPTACRAAFGNRGHVLVRGKRAPIVGAVSMDMAMIDVTDVAGVGSPRRGRRARRAGGAARQGRHRRRRDRRARRHDPVGGADQHLAPRPPLLPRAVDARAGRGAAARGEIGPRERRRPRAPTRHRRCSRVLAVLPMSSTRRARRSSTTSAPRSCSAAQAAGLGSFARPFASAQLLIALDFIGAGSTFIVALVGLFTGMAFTVSTIVGFRQFSAEGMVGGVVALALARELAPVLAAVVVTARAGSTMASELGNMRVTEQIDAITTMGVSPVQYLVVAARRRDDADDAAPRHLLRRRGHGRRLPRRRRLAGHRPGRLLRQDRASSSDVSDLRMLVGKSLVFGLIVSVICCKKGFYASGGARGVGEATAKAVVASIVAIFASDYVTDDAHDRPVTLYFAPPPHWLAVPPPPQVCGRVQARR